MLVVVDAIELATEAPPTSLTTVFYLDDCGTIRSERIPWGILSTCSVELLDEERRIRCEEMDEEYSARENLRTNARLKAIHDAVSDSSDPMSLFGLLRKAVLDLLHSGFEVDHRGSPEDVASREGPAPETARCSTDSPAICSADDATVLERYRRADAVLRGAIDIGHVPTPVGAGETYVAPGVVIDSSGNLPHAGDLMKATEVGHPDPLEGQFGSSMSCLSQSELEQAIREEKELPLEDIKLGTFVPHTHF
jgi:hypothetical protein